MNFKYRYGLLFLLSVAVLACLFFVKPFGLHEGFGRVVGSRHHKSLGRLPRRLSHVSNNFTKGNFFDSPADGNIAGQDIRSFTILSGESYESGAKISRDNIFPFGAGRFNRPPSHGCRMQNCFDHAICEKNGFKVYVYPPNPSAPIVSGKYKEILGSIRRSRYYTDDPEEACIFVLSLDTLDRDQLSTQYIHNLGNLLKHLSLWRGGANHVVFNLYSGTWPDYSENDIGIDLGMAMLAKSSISQQHFRPEFDISLPLFHKEHSYKGGEGGFLLSSGTLAGHRRYTLVFKGKRYLAGIGSETRNSLHHIDNRRDIILLTTCKHGKDWKNMEDERCEHDNKEYDKWDYKVLLKNSTFCLVPRGRRLGSYRFLEALQAGCIPVILSNDWVLPFSEVIDWRKAVIWADERLLLQLPTIVRSMDMKTILSMSQQTQFLWQTYFSSMDKIVATALEIIKSRLETTNINTRTAQVWNSYPGSLAFLPEHSQSLDRYPFYDQQVRPRGIKSSTVRSRPSNATEPSSTRKVELELEPLPRAMFDGVVYATNLSLPLHSPQSPLHRLLKTLVKCKGLRKVYVMWDLTGVFIPSFKWVHLPVPVIHLRMEKQVGKKHLFLSDDDNDDESHADAILNLDENSQLITDEIDFGFHVWKNFPDRIVGYYARSHFWHDSKESWRYTSKATSEFSMVLTSPAFYHRYYNRLYVTTIPPSLKQLASTCGICHDIIMNSLVSHVTKLPPVKVGSRHKTMESPFQRLKASDEIVHINNRLEMISNSNQKKLEVEDYETNRDGDQYDDIRRNIEADNRVMSGPDDVGIYDRFHKKNFYVPLAPDPSSLRNNNHSLNIAPPLSKGGNFAESKSFRHFECAHYCLQAVTDYLGYVPLLKSTLRINPLLFKDPVSRLRKKYPGLDKIT